MLGILYNARVHFFLDRKEMIMRFLRLIRGLLSRSIEWVCAPQAGYYELQFCPDEKRVRAVPVQRKD